ncbi:MAG: hypothetical protein H6765_10280 [Candidatus Peribacteria bacterium]|nr:MAG: hypothetical protein H6765_10280 [Candidatus Peribacteria bacterium]
MLAEIHEHIDALRVAAVEENTSYAGALNKALDQLKELNVEAAQKSLEHVELPELVVNKLRELEQLMHTHLTQTTAQSRQAPSLDSSQDVKDAYAAEQALQSKLQIEQDYVQLLQDDMANPDNYPNDPLSRAVYTGLKYVSKLLKNTDI